MPGKINPVIPEFIVSIAHKVYANDMLISSLCAQGCLDLNAYLPVIGHSIIESIKLLISANISLKNNLLAGLQIDSQKSELKVYKSPSIVTALSPYIGYHKAAELAHYMKVHYCDVFAANNNLLFIENFKLKEILQPGNLLKLGFSIKEISD